MLKIAVASGKGGTGKTTIATSLAVVLVEKKIHTTYLDCDVEEPNGHIFLKPEINGNYNVDVPIPEVDPNKCTFCGECSKICRYNAIAVLSDKVMIFPSLCHSCGGCFFICPERAISELPRTIGTINTGNGHNVTFLDGRLNVGEALAPPMTRHLKKIAPDSDVTVIDAPPGTSCPVIEAINDSDYVILVTEPTPFGLNDLKLAVAMLRELKLPFGVVINRSDTGDDSVEGYCRTNQAKILLKIPFSRKIAEAYSRGTLPIEVDENYRERIFDLFNDIRGEIDHD
jgi:MinD superfamily P-loop ATPase